MRTKALRFALLGFALVYLAAPADAARIIVNHDEWTLSDTGFSQAGAGNVTTFVNNLASFMNQNGGACSYLVYSSNFGFLQGNFQGAMAGTGCALTYFTGPFNTGAGTLANYDGVFLALPPDTYDPAVLANYVNSGGSAYIAAGTGSGGAAAEAAHWNTFLNGFGLTLGSPYNGCCGNDLVQQSHVIETGVNQLYYNNGNTVSLFGANAFASVIESSVTGVGLIGVYDDTASVPEPGAIVLLTLGLIATLAGRSRLNRIRG
jgi:hypothetical protein